MTELEKALSGQQFSRRDGEVAKFQSEVKDLVYDFNHLRPSDPKRTEIIKQLVTGYNPYVFIEDGFRCVFGKNIRFKGMAMINYGCTFLDSNFIDIGHCALIGPNCNLICTNHSRILRCVAKQAIHSALKRIYAAISSKYRESKKFAKNFFTSQNREVKI